ncbi:MAG: tyrosine-type recombinase/integrase [Bacillota bacterium]|nr:tyrosine-type recombinase/integrase [Bacillota bacterium]
MTGLRCAELCTLTVSDAHIEQGFLKVMGKGSKGRVVPIGASAEKVLLRYLYTLRPEPARPDITNLFLTLDGLPMSVNGVARMIRRLGEVSGVRKIHAHLCRHTFATNYLINGGDVISLQEILGHTTLEMVRRYVSLASSQVAVQHRKYSPMDRLAIKQVSTLVTQTPKVRVRQWERKH